MKITRQVEAKITAVVLVLALLSGCANRPQPLYYWGDYENQQYGYLKGNNSPEEGIQALEQTKQEAKSKGKSLPPGMSAHLGLLYGLTGRTDLFEQHLQAERIQFPESSSYVDFLMKQSKTN